MGAMASKKYKNSVLGLRADQIANAFGVCLSQAAGSMEFLVDGAWTKRFQVGYAAMNGLVAATLAAEGYKGPDQPIEGEAGFLKAYAPNPVMPNAVAGLGERYETMAIGVKPYPSCRYSHAAMDGLIALRAEHGFDIADIQSVEIGLPKTGWDIIGDPEDDKRNPESIVDGQFSMPFLAAVVLRQGSMGWDDYAKHLKDPETLDLCRKVSSVVDPLPEAEFPRQMSGVARVRTRNGDFEKFVVVPTGEPENFPDMAALRAKFDALSAPYIDPANADRYQPDGSGRRWGSIAGYLAGDLRFRAPVPSAPAQVVDEGFEHRMKESRTISRPAKLTNYPTTELFKYQPTSQTFLSNIFQCRLVTFCNL